MQSNKLIFFNRSPLVPFTFIIICHTRFLDAYIGEAETWQKRKSTVSGGTRSHTSFAKHLRILFDNGKYRHFEITPEKVGAFARSNGGRLLVDEYKLQYRRKQAASKQAEQAIVEGEKM